MNANQDFDRTLTEFYSAEGLVRAPDRVLSTALTTIETTRQRRALGRLPVPLLSSNAVGQFALAAVLVIAVTAAGLAILSGNRPGLGGPPSPTASPAVSPTATPSTTARPGEQGSGNFVVPFTYVLPEGAEFDYGTRNPTYFEVRIPAAAEAGHPAGIIIQAIGGGRVNPCDEESARLPIASGPQAVIDYLATVPDLTVTAEAPATVGDLPAVQAQVRASTTPPTCQEVWPWVEATEAFTDIPRDVVVRMVAVDVGEHVVFTIFGEDENPGWAEMAEELIDSFRFAS